MRISRSSIAAVSALVTLVACTAADGPGAPSPELTASARAAIVGGTADPGDVAVVAVLNRVTTCGARSTTALCSGTLIAPRVVLTAAHCVDPIETGPFDVYVGARLDDGGRVVAVLEVLVHPRYDAASHAFDAALLRLADAPDVTPVAIAPGPIDVRAGDAVRAVGFGVDGDSGTFPDTKRQGTMSVTASSAETFDSAPSPSMTCAGDSGGPVFVGNPADGETLAGITVKGDPGCRQSAQNLRVDAIRDDFIAPFVAAAAQAAPGVPAGTIAIDRLCEDGCTTSADCPAALACTEVDPGTKRCTFPGGRWGNLGAPCAAAGSCGPSEECVNDPSIGACSCFVPCAGQPGPPPPGGPSRSDAGSGDATSNGGCASAPRNADSGWAWLAPLAVVVAARRRSRRSPRDHR